MRGVLNKVMCKAGVQATASCTAKVKKRKKGKKEKTMTPPADHKNVSEETRTRLVQHGGGSDLSHDS
jgi:hypothetical protein